MATWPLNMVEYSWRESPLESFDSTISGGLAKLLPAYFVADRLDIFTQPLADLFHNSAAAWASHRHFIA